MRRAEFRAIYTRYADDVHRFAFWLSGDWAQAEDLTAETFAKAWVGRDRIRCETVKAYLLAITRNEYLKLRRASTPAVMTREPATSGSAEDRLLQREELRRVLDELQKVAERDRCAFLMRALHEIPYREIAIALKTPVSTAKVAVHRVRLRLALAREGR